MSTTVVSDRIESAKGMNGKRANFAMSLGRKCYRKSRTVIHE